MSEIAAALAELDATAGLAELARHEGYTRPVVDGSEAFEIRGGRHPVVEQALASAKAGPFIENDCVLGRAEPSVAAEEVEGGRIWLVTGPNMAGKSTFLRQNALDRCAGADGLLRAGALGDHRRGRPPVQPRRRLRRSRARTFHVHGRDGRDGRHPQSGEPIARSSSWTRSAAAPRPSTACRSPGRRSSSCTRWSARARCLRPTIMS